MSPGKGKRSLPRPYLPGDENMRASYVAKLGLSTDTALFLWSKIKENPGITSQEMADDTGSSAFYMRVYLRELESSGLITQAETSRRVRGGRTYARWKCVGETPSPHNRLPGMSPSRIPAFTAILEEREEPITTRLLARTVGCNVPSAERTLSAMVARGEVVHCGTDDTDQDLWA